MLEMVTLIVFEYAAFNILLKSGIRPKRPMTTPFDLNSILNRAGLPKPLLETDPAVIYILDSNLRIIYCNHAWEVFAAENGGRNLSREEILGKAVLEFVPEPLLKFYSNAMTEVGRTGNIWEHDYECSSMDLYRLFHMRIIPLPGSSLLVENSLRVEKRHWLDDSAPLEDSEYINEHGILTCCCHCRRTLRVRSGQKSIWDWIPRFLAIHSAQVSHGLCQTCRYFFYPHVQGGQPGKSHEETGL